MHKSQQNKYGVGKSSSRRVMGGGGDAAATESTSSSSSWIQATMKCAEEYGVITIVFLFISAGFYYVIHAPGYLQRNLEKYFFILCLPLILLFFLMLRIENKEGLGAVSVKVGGLLLLAGVVAWLYTQTTTSYWASMVLSWGFFIAIVVVALAFVYGYLVGEIRRWKGWPGFIAQVAFFVPCMLKDAWGDLMNELNLTSVSVYLALFLEVVFIVLYALLPRISQTLMGTSSDSEALVLLDKPVRLKDTYKQLTGSTPLYDRVNATFRKNYAISLWIYMTPFTQQVSGYHSETDIFSYGYTSKKNGGVRHVKPLIRYYGGGVAGENAEDRNKFIFYFSRFAKDAIVYDAELPAQRWNYVVMNYSNNEVNLYLNGELKTTVPLHRDLPVYDPLDSIAVGSPDAGQHGRDGVHGAVCNVVYYKHTLTPEQIAFSYNLLKDKDPPLLASTATSPAVSRKR